MFAPKLNNPDKMKNQLNQSLQEIKQLFKVLLFVPLLVSTSSVLGYQNDAKVKTGDKKTGEMTVFLPSGYTSTQSTINKERVTAQMLKDFYFKSGGKDVYIIYKNKDGVEVSEAEVIQKHKEENATSKAPAFSPSK